jgi:hypothetical protein
MLAEQFHSAISTARNLPALEGISRLLWRAHGEGHLPDADAQGLAEAVEARKATLKGPRPSPSSKRASTRPRPCRSPDRQRSIARRRAVAMSGTVPSRIATSFTVGELAALSIVAGEVRRRGTCTLPIDAIAAQAGICRTIVQGALRQARALGLVHVQERPQPGRKHLPNIVSITSPDWRAWLRLGDRVQISKHHEYKVRLNTYAQANADKAWQFSACSAIVGASQKETPSCNRKTRF